MRYIFTSTNIFWSSASDANLEDKNLDEAVSGGQKTKRHRSQQGSNDCDALTDENVEVEVVREGQSKVSHAKGSVLKVSCKRGYQLNLSKRKVRCKRGEWKPAMPKCNPLGCVLPKLTEQGDTGFFKAEGVRLPHRQDYSSSIICSFHLIVLQ